MTRSSRSHNAHESGWKCGFCCRFGSPYAFYFCFRDADEKDSHRHGV